MNPWIIPSLTDGNSVTLEEVKVKVFFTSLRQDCFSVYTMQEIVTRNNNEGEANKWDRSVKVEESGYYWRGEPLTFKRDFPKGNNPKVVELFCGCGGTSTGFEMAGYDVVLGSDIFIPAIDTFKLNHKNASVVLGDLRKVTTDHIMNLLGDRQIDVLVAGVPCQGFSLNNRKRHEGDERNMLYKEFIRFLKVIKPKALVLENVSGMKSTGDFVEKIEQDLSSASGMIVKSKLLYAPDYGVPQARSRLLFIGTVNGFDFNEIIKTHGSETGVPYNSVRNAIGDLPSLKSNGKARKYESEPFSDYQKLMRCNVQSLDLYNHRAPNHPKKVIEMIRSTKPGDPMYEKYRQRIRLSWDDLSPTQVSGGIRPSFQFGHPQDARGLTIRERCRLQSFPDDFVVCGGIVQGRVQTGNAVPPLLAKAVALAIRKYL